ncbi:hypothetical protein [Streptomyces clavifer]|uniref:hypothetical protein n=1 Tax=Streptomyces clavifer TaxID=68188 RepID=UPI0033CC2B66
MATQPFWVMHASAPQVWEFSDVAAVTWSARMGVIGACIVMPPGTVPVSIHPGHSYDPATRTLCRTTAAGDDESAFSHPGTDTLTFTQAGTGRFRVWRSPHRGVANSALAHRRCALNGFDLGFYSDASVGASWNVPTRLGQPACSASAAYGPWPPSPTASSTTSSPFPQNRN